MLLQYIETALELAHYEIIEDKEPFYGEVPQLQGVWATGKTLEECRHNLAAAIEDWVLFSVAKGLPIPSLGEAAIRLPKNRFAGLQVCRFQVGKLQVDRVASGSHQRWSAFQCDRLEGLLTFAYSKIQPHSDIRA